MRKQDYAILAALIKAKLAHYKQHPQGQIGQQACAALAYEFAARASVNKAEFLKACGIE